MTVTTGRSTVAVDAMGGDGAPDAVVEGALRAATEGNCGVVLVGPEAAVRAALARLAPASTGEVEVVDAPAFIEMAEAALAGLRRKPQASIRVAAELVAAGRADALFSAGHTGATLLTAHAVFGKLPEVERPALAVTVPTSTGAAVLVDAGANVECRPQHLVQFGVMGAAYATLSLGCVDPAVGLLSTGEEAGKGTDLIREAHAALGAAPLRFIGNLEARDLFTGKADVVVCDGFTGNIALKVGEGLAEMIERRLGVELAASTDPIVPAALARLHRRLDAAEYGGAPLLGLNALAVVGHGRSSPTAVRNGILTAARLAGEAMVRRLRDALARASTGPEERP